MFRKTPFSLRTGALHASEPLRNGFGIESNASSDVERGNSPGCGLLEDRYPRHVKELRKFLSGQGATDLLDLICDRHR
jgi:hypothetical protein